MTHTLSLVSVTVDARMPNGGNAPCLHVITSTGTLRACLALCELRGDVLHVRSGRYGRFFAADVARIEAAGVPQRVKAPAAARWRRAPVEVAMKEGERVTTRAVPAASRWTRTTTARRPLRRRLPRSCGSWKTTTPSESRR